MDRRPFLTGLTGLTAVAAARAPGLQAMQGRRATGPPAVPIIDTHIHLFDPTRPQGVPYAGPRGGGPPVPSLPAGYRRVAEPLGIVGAIHVEASPWIEDNLWVLQVAETDTVVVGVIDNLEPDKPEFAEYFESYDKKPLFFGIG